MTNEPIIEYSMLGDYWSDLQPALRRYAPIFELLSHQDIETVTIETIHGGKPTYRIKPAHVHEFVCECGYKNIVAGYKNDA